MSDDSVAILPGDLVETGGFRFHVKDVTDEKIQYWAEDTGETRVETIDELTERARQNGDIGIRPGAGKFDNDGDYSDRSVYIETA